MIDNRTPHFDLPLPDKSNYLEDDVARLSESISAIDYLIDQRPTADDLADPIDPAKGAYGLVANALVRVESVASLRALPSPRNKAVAYVEGYYPGDGMSGWSYRWKPDSRRADTGGNVIRPSDSTGPGRWEFSGDFDIRRFGAIPSKNVDNTAIINTAIAAADVGDVIVIPDGLTFGHTGPIAFDGENHVRGTGILYYFGTTTAANAIVTITKPTHMQTLRLQNAGTHQTWADMLVCDTNDVHIGRLEVISDRQDSLMEGAVTFKGSGHRIGTISTENIKRGVAFMECTGFSVGMIGIEGYVRGLYLHKCSQFSIDYLKTERRFPGAVFGPGKNSVLFEETHDFTMGDLDLYDATEAAFRFGGNGDIYNFEIGNVRSVNSGGCGFKSNVNTGFFAKNGHIKSIETTNPSEGSDEGNREAVRLTKMKSTHIGYIGQYAACSKVFRVADLEGVSIGRMYGEGIRQRGIEFNSTQDESDGKIDGLDIGSLELHMASSARAGIEFAFGDTNTARTLGNISIRDAVITGFAHSPIRFDTSATARIADLIEIEYRVLPSAPRATIENCPANDLFQVHAQQSNRHYFGRGADVAFCGDRTFSSPVFDPANASPSQSQKGAMTLSSGAIVGGQNVPGNPLQFGRIGSAAYRGAAIAGMQTGTVSRHMGLAFYGQMVGTTDDETLRLLMILKHHGAPNFPAMTTASNNAAAIAAGLAPGDEYKTATGERRVVV